MPNADPDRIMIGVQDKWYYRHFGTLVAIPAAIILYALTGLTKIPISYNEFPLLANFVGLIWIPIILNLIIKKPHFQRRELQFLILLIVFQNCLTSFFVGLIALDPDITDDGMGVSWVIVIPLTLIFSFLFGLFNDVMNKRVKSTQLSTNRDTD
jgi:hypothetical protein